jgi:hypothetical protein
MTSTGLFEIDVEIELDSAIAAFRIMGADIRHIHIRIGENRSTDKLAEDPPAGAHC